MHDSPSVSELSYLYCAFPSGDMDHGVSGCSLPDSALCELFRPQSMAGRASSPCTLYHNTTPSAPFSLALSAADSLFGKLLACNMKLFSRLILVWPGNPKEKKIEKENGAKLSLGVC